MWFEGSLTRWPSADQTFRLKGKHLPGLYENALDRRMLQSDHTTAATATITNTTLLQLLLLSY